MEKKALTVAVAGALAAPALALAQSNVTISGYVHMSVDNIRISQPAPTRTTTSESRVNDESSSGVILQVREELGGGNAALVRVDVKTNLDTSTIAASGESYVACRSTTRGGSPWDGTACTSSRRPTTAGSTA